METKAGPLGATMKVTRKLWMLLLASILLIPALVEISVPPPRSHSKSFRESIMLMAVLCVVGWGVVRRKYIGKAKLQLSQDPKHSQALRRWQAGYVISFMMSEAVALYGVNLRYRGVALREVAPFYVAGFILMVFSAPKPPVDGVNDTQLVQ